MKLINLDEICSLVPLITLKPGYPTFPSGRVTKPFGRRGRCRIVLLVQSVPITTKVVSSNPVHGEV